MNDNNPVNTDDELIILIDDVAGVGDADPDLPVIPLYDPNAPVEQTGGIEPVVTDDNVGGTNAVMMTDSTMTTETVVTDGTAGTDQGEPVVMLDDTEAEGGTFTVILEQVADAGLNVTDSGTSDVDVIPLDDEPEEDIRIYKAPIAGEGEYTLDSTAVIPSIPLYEEPPVLDADDLEYDDDAEPGFGGAVGTVFNRLLIVFGIFITIIAIFVGISYLQKLKTPKETVDFSDVGKNVAEIGYIGEDNIVAITGAESKRLDELNVAIDNFDYNEVDEETGVTPITVTLTTILKDIKIKVVNGKNKLIANVPFVVEVKDSKGKTVEVTDDDKDGIVYVSDLDGGTYTVKLLTLDGYDTLYDFSSAAIQSINVKSKLDYKKVDVSNEIKDASQINTATEDTAEKDTEEESALKDTVAYVMSTKTAEGNGYAALDKNTEITDPVETLRKLYEQASAGRFTRLKGSIVTTDEAAPSEGEGQGGETHTHSYTYTSTNDGKHTASCSCGDTTSQDCTPGDYAGGSGTHSRKCSLCGYVISTEACIDENSDGKCDKCGSDMPAIEATLQLTGKASHILYFYDETETKLTATVNFTSGEATITGYSWSFNGDSIVTEEALSAQTISYTPVKGGTTTVTCEATLSTGAKVTGMIQITIVKPEVTFNFTTQKITFIPTNDVEKEAYKLTYVASMSDTTRVVSDPKSFVWTSSDTNVATVDANGVVTGVGEGSCTIRATFKSGDKEIKDLYKDTKVVVSKLPKNDTSTKLTDNTGKPVYVYDSGSKTYKEATYSDYYTGTTLYKQVDITYKYSGWWTIDGKTYYFDANGKKVTGEQVILGAKYSFDSDGVLKNGTGAFGIDVSSWNGNIDWTKVAKSGVSYAIIRCGFRGSTVGGLVSDSKFAQNIKAATDAGIKVGVYFFTQAITEAEAVEEASMVLQLISGYKITYPVFIDVENATNGRANSLSVANRTAIIKAFCETIETGGYKAGIYANKTWLNNKINTSELGKYKIWLAQYAETPTYTSRYEMWQYSDSGSITGISGSVDLNLSYLGY